MHIPSVPRDPATFPAYPDNQTAKADLIEYLISRFALEPISAIEWQCPTGWGIANRIRTDDIFFCILSGSYAGCVENIAHESMLSAGDSLLIPSGVPHWIRRIAGDCRMVSLHMNTRVYGNINALRLFSLAGVQKNPGDDIYRSTAMRLAREDALRPAGWKQTMRAGMETVFFSTLRHSGSSASFGAAQINVQEIVRLKPALDYIKANLGNPFLRISDLARATHVSEAALRKWFKRALGTSPVIFLRRERIALACNLLRKSDETIPAILQKVGFRDAPFFYRVFKSVVGTTPGLYRQFADE
jgi:AraC-like DNA-binding protein